METDAKSFHSLRDNKVAADIREFLRMTVHSQFPPATISEITLDLGVSINRALGSALVCGGLF